jgi:hypothetical protein
VTGDFGSSTDADSHSQCSMSFYIGAVLLLANALGPVDA